MSRLLRCGEVHLAHLRPLYGFPVSESRLGYLMIQASLNAAFCVTQVAIMPWKVLCAKELTS